jgi:hypothetical protein
LAQLSGLIGVCAPKCASTKDARGSWLRQGVCRNRVGHFGPGLIVPCVPLTRAGCLILGFREVRAQLGRNRPGRRRHHAALDTRAVRCLPSRKRTLWRPGGNHPVRTAMNANFQPKLDRETRHWTTPCTPVIVSHLAKAAAETRGRLP